ncbi:hypothetical protein VTN96DRAFT_7133 [Rasamsonia emersonii]
MPIYPPALAWPPATLFPSHLLCQPVSCPSRESTDCAVWGCNWGHRSHLPPATSHSLSSVPPYCRRPPHPPCIRLDTTAAYIAVSPQQVCHQPRLLPRTPCGCPAQARVTAIILCSRRSFPGCSFPNQVSTLGTFLTNPLIDFLLFLVSSFSPSLSPHVADVHHPSLVRLLVYLRIYIPPQPSITGSSCSCGKYLLDKLGLVEGCSD